MTEPHIEQLEGKTVKRVEVPRSDDLSFIRLTFNDGTVLEVVPRSDDALFARIGQTIWTDV